MNLQNRISDWLKSYLEDNNLKTFVVGISGGIDSAVTSTLCAMTGRKTTVVTMPIYQNPDETDRGKRHINWLKDNYSNIVDYHINLTETYEDLKQTISGLNIENSEDYKRSLANTRARIRMSTLYLISGGLKGMVVDQTTDNADNVLDSLSKKYIDEDIYPFRKPGVTTILVKIRPEKKYVVEE